jgi:carboxylesterase type B
MNVEDLYNFQNALANRKRSAFGPTVEGFLNSNTFLPADPVVLMKSRRINAVPWMTGVNADEGLVYLIRKCFSREVDSRSKAT